MYATANETVAWYVKKCILKNFKKIINDCFFNIYYFSFKGDFVFGSAPCFDMPLSSSSKYFSITSS